jgi:hypothetical protein
VTIWEGAPNEANTEDVGPNRCWIKVQCEEGPLAIGVMYMGTQTPQDTYGDHNDSLYIILDKDCELLAKDNIPTII